MSQRHNSKHNHADGDEHDLGQKSEHEHHDGLAEYIIRPGERIPADGVVTKGHSFVDQSSITGESLPVEKVETSKVFAGTINKDGVLEVIVEKIGRDTTFGSEHELSGAGSASERGRGSHASLPVSRSHCSVSATITRAGAMFRRKQREICGS
jgi:E1-E2 ATPase